MCSPSDNMCCNDKIDRKFARNVKKPSTFLNSLVVKRRRNRRASKPSMILDAVLSNAIKNIEKDQILSKFANTGKVKKSNTPLHQHTALTLDSGRSKLECGGIMDEKNCFFEDVDSFFDRLKNASMKEKVGTIETSDLHMNSVNISTENCPDSGSSTNPVDESTQKMVDYFIETGLYGL